MDDITIHVDSPYKNSITTSDLTVATSTIAYVPDSYIQLMKGDKEEEKVEEEEKDNSLNGIFANLDELNEKVNEQEEQIITMRKDINDWLVLRIGQLTADNKRQENEIKLLETRIDELDNLVHELLKK